MALKGIEKEIEKFCVQTAVYWGNPQSDGYGGYSYDSPVELSPDDNNGVRWEEKSELDIGWVSTGHPGNVKLSKSQVMVLQDLDENGYLWLGTLDDLESQYTDTSDPMKITGAYPILRFDKIPMVFKTDEFVRTAYLYDQGR